jgi:hypothetical protein
VIIVALFILNAAIKSFNNISTAFNSADDRSSSFASAPVDNRVGSNELVTRVPHTLLVVEGSGSKSTQSVTVPRQWELVWKYDCSNFGQQGNFMVFIYNSNGTIAEPNGVNQLGIRGSDTEYYHQGGTFYFVVNSECSWNINVIG